MKTGPCSRPSSSRTGSPRAASTGRSSWPGRSSGTSRSTSTTHGGGRCERRHSARPRRPRASAAVGVVARDDRGHPVQGRAGPLHEPRPRHDQAPAPLRRPDVRPVHPVARPARGVPRGVCDVDRDRRPPRREADQARDAHHDRGDELRGALPERQAGARDGRDPGRHLDHDRRRRHARPRAGGVGSARLPGAAEPLRLQPAPPADGERGRDRRRPGREARHRRRAARRQGLADHRRRPHASAGRRPALAGPPPGLRRPGRHADQDRGAARGDRRPDPDLRQDRRLPRPRRRQAGRARPAPT